MSVEKGTEITAKTSLSLTQETKNHNKNQKQNVLFKHRDRHGTV